MQTNKNVKGRAIFSDKDEIRERSLKLYMYLVCRANLRNAPNKFGDNVRIFQQRDVVLSQIKRILKIGDERTIKKYWEELERANLIRFCPHGWKEVLYIEVKKENGEKETKIVPFNERWKIRNKHKDTYYEIPVRQEMLFRKIPKETLVKLNEEYCVDELTLKVYMTLVNYQEECITNGLNYKTFTYQDLREILGYAQKDSTNKKLEDILTHLRSLGLIDLESGKKLINMGLKFQCLF